MSEEYKKKQGAENVRGTADRGITKRPRNGMSKREPVKSAPSHQKLTKSLADTLKLKSGQRLIVNTQHFDQPIRGKRGFNQYTVYNKDGFIDRDWVEWSYEPSVRDKPDAITGAGHQIIEADRGLTRKPIPRPIPTEIDDAERRLEPPPTRISFPDQKAIIGRIRTRPRPDPSLSGRVKAKVKEAKKFTEKLLKTVSLIGGDYPYNSFELRGPPPPPVVLPKGIAPGTVEAKKFSAAKAVGYWLFLHRKHIRAKAKEYGISRIAIAGAIAWEALVNPSGTGRRAVGPGKMHIEREDGALGWPEVIEQVYPRDFNKRHRINMLRTPNGAINYIAACLDIIARLAEEYGFMIRHTPEVLLLAYHAHGPEGWKKVMAAKKSGSLFTLEPETMSTWVLENYEFLTAAIDAE